MRVDHGRQRPAPHVAGKVFPRCELPVARVGHVGIDHDLQVTRREQRGELGQEPFERGSIQVGKQPVVARDSDRGQVDVELEVDRLRRISRLAMELAPLDVEARRSSHPMTPTKAPMIAGTSVVHSMYVPKVSARR